MTAKSTKASSAEANTTKPTEIKNVRIITDGACLGNPGPGGWACILRYKDHTKEIFGSERQTTNNRMELTAALNGLRLLKGRCKVEVITDSEYLKNGITQWIAGWKRKNWMTAAKKPVLNRDIWEVLDAEVERHDVSWSWTKGHASHADNNRADELASLAAKEQSHS